MQFMGIEWEIIREDTQSDFVFVKNTLGLAPCALRLGHRSSCEKKVFLSGQTVYPPPPLSTVNFLRPLKYYKSNTFYRYSTCEHKYYICLDGRLPFPAVFN